MVAKPVLGYPSKKDAVWAMLDQGKSHKEIAEAVGQSEPSIYAQASQKRNAERRAKGGSMDTDLRLKALRIYTASLDVIGEALGVEPVVLHGIFSGVKLSDLEALRIVYPTRQLSDETGQLTEAEVVEAERLADLPSWPADAPRYRLRSLSGKMLHESTFGLTPDKHNAWIGTEREAAAVCAKSEMAARLTLVPA